MSPRWRVVVMLPWLLGGCAVDLWVGDPADTETSEATTTASDGGTTMTPPSTDTGTSTTGPVPDTTDAGTTVAVDEGTSSTGPTLEEGTSTGPTEEAGSTTTTEIPCEGLGINDCNELEYCLWYGLPEEGECAPSPCANPKHDCFFFGFEACEAAFACAWVGDPEMGECGPIECVPCEVLGGDQCMKTPTCTWDEGEMFCLPA